MAQEVTFKFNILTVWENLRPGDKLIPDRETFTDDIRIKNDSTC